MKLSLKKVLLVLVISLTCSPLIIAQVSTVVCRHCGNYIASTSRLCPTCGKNPQSPTGDPFWDLLYYSIVEYENQKSKGHINQNNNSSYQSQNSNHFSLQGTIGSKSTIKGYIIISGTQISGNYGYYGNHGCTLRGTINKNGSVKATEIEDRSGKQTGSYVGKLENNGKIRGTFTNKKGKKFKFTWLLH